MRHSKIVGAIFKLNASDTMREMLTPKALAKNTFFIAITIGLCLIWLHILTCFFPQSISPFHIYDVWKTEGNFGQWVALGLPIYLWSCGVTFLSSFLTRNSPKENRNAEGYLLAGLYASLLAGITEEIRFRWLYFYLCMISVRITNFLFFGWLGLPIGKWIHVYIGGPVFNVLTLGYLSDYLVTPSIWYVGSALLIINAKFRDGNAYQGPLGYINSWVLGFFFFWLTLNYGLLSAIVVHFIYDALLYTIEYVDRKIEFFSGNR